MTPTNLSEPANKSRGVVLWLCLICMLLVVMVVVGGATRLTDSGLSITEWRPITGAVPPLTQEGWEAELEKYRQIPEYQLINKGMSLDEFKFIYWWEWGHRFLGRLIGLVFFVPFVFFWATRRLNRPLIARLGIIFLLGGAQGALGWWMVASGLTERVDVSQYRLAAHLGLAFIIFGFVLWVIFDLLNPPKPKLAVHKWFARALIALTGLIFLQILYGALVAGLRAGRIYNTWPAMDGGFFPDSYWFLSPWYLNFFENQAGVQFNHRLLAYFIVFSILALLVWGRRAKLPAAVMARLNLLAGITFVQMVLGISALLFVVPISLGLAHQVGALLLFGVSLYAVHGAIGRAVPRSAPRGQSAEFVQQSP